MRNDVTKEDLKLEEELLDLVAEEGLVDRDTIARDTKLEDLDIASADFIMILMAIEEKYDAYISVDNELSEIKTVQDLLTIACKKIREAQDGSGGGTAAQVQAE